MQLVDCSSTCKNRRFFQEKPKNKPDALLVKIPQTNKQISFLIMGQEGPACCVSHLSKVRQAKGRSGYYFQAGSTLALFTIPSFAPNYFLLCIYEELGFHTQRDLVTSGSCLFHTTSSFVLCLLAVFTLSRAALLPPLLALV